MDWMTKLVSADGGDAGVAIVDARPLKCIAQEIWPARHVLRNGAGQPEKLALRSPAGQRLVTQPV
jgi:hypothetical protein